MTYTLEASIGDGWNDCKTGEHQGTPGKNPEAVSVRGRPNPAPPPRPPSPPPTGGPAPRGHGRRGTVPPRAPCAQIARRTGRCRHAAPLRRRPPTAERGSRP